VEEKPRVDEDKTRDTQESLDREARRASKEWLVGACSAAS